MAASPRLTPRPPMRRKLAETSFTPIQVFLRLKPLPEEVDASITRIDDETVAMHTSATASAYGDNSAPQIEVTEQDKYHFSHVFGPETQQQELYSSTAEPLVEQLFSGQDGLVFAYGPTNSGKTFTIQGGKEENAGILPRVLNRIFGHVQERQQAGEMWSVWVNFMEIYNESIYDLLEDRQTQVSESRPKCELKENNGRIIVKGLKQMQVTSHSPAQIREGSIRRVWGSGVGDFFSASSFWSLKQSSMGTIEDFGSGV